ncbi:MAG: hypothetical protein HXY50_08155 [Ignavibacteriaceae bacterium]|nr:hypothetical protein [Ignavibacteriaceae bacterium]
MAGKFAYKNNREIEMNMHNTILTNSNEEDKHRVERIRTKINAIYNPERNPRYYLHNNLNWYKNFN